MKSGIYQTPNSNLILVRKDRTIAATTLKPSSWPGMKVSHRAADDTVLIEGTNYRCHRVGDLRNGENRDPELVLREFEAQRAAKINEVIGFTGGETILRHVDAEVRDGDHVVIKTHSGETVYDGPAASLRSRTLASGGFLSAQNVGKTDVRVIESGYYFTVEQATRTLRDLGYRPCHRQSARKHRKAGHIVTRMAGDSRYWWRTA